MLAKLFALDTATARTADKAPHPSTLTLVRLRRFVARSLPNRLKGMALSNVPRSYRAFKYAPATATLNITDNCFFRCVMCDQWKTHKTGELTPAEWKRVISELKTMNIGHVSFAGGEPFMRKDIFELFAHIQSEGMTSSVISNGFVLDRPKLETAMASGLRTIGISMDAVGAEFDTIRGIAGAFERLVSTCRLLAEYQKTHGLEVHLYFTLMRKTLASYRDVFELARSFGFLFVVNLVDTTPYFFKELSGKKDEFWIDRHDPQLAEFQNFLIAEKAKDPNAIHATFSEIGYFSKYFADPIQKELPCVVSQNRLGIDSKGHVYGGCWSMGPFGSVRDSPLGDIVASTAYRAAHQKMFKKDCPGCSCGYSGNLRPSLKYQVPDVAYNLMPTLRSRIAAST